MNKLHCSSNQWLGSAAGDVGWEMHRAPKLKMREDDRAAKQGFCYHACCVTRLSIYRLLTVPC